MATTLIQTIAVRSTSAQEELLLIGIAPQQLVSMEVSVIGKIKTQKNAVVYPENFKQFFLFCCNTITIPYC